MKKATTKKQKKPVKKVVKSRKKQFPYLIFGIITAFVVALVFFAAVGKSSWLLNSSSVSRPEIVEHLACPGDCSGNLSDYRIRVYNGVDNSQECLRLGGQPYTYFNKKSTTVCQAP